MNTTNKSSEDRAERRLEAREQEKELLANGKDRKRRGSAKINKLWLWLGVIILIFILFYWIFSIGLFEDLTGFINGN